MLLQVPTGGETGTWVLPLRRADQQIVNQGVDAFLMEVRIMLLIPGTIEIGVGIEQSRASPDKVVM